MAVKTSADIQIENKSYTNKDFSQLYPELLDLVKKLTNKWDPETTNESDPGLVLLKLLAFIADKNNYNIDKNILEQFMPSVTQEENMRKLCDMMGYNVKYYRSATTEISFTYLGGNATLDAVLGIESENTDTTQTVVPSGVFHIKAFDTSFKTEDNIVYTLLEDIEITKEVRTSSKKAIQGQIKALNLNQGSTTSLEATKIQLYNLDENNRIYIPDTMVAENGIFINREIYNKIYNEDAWKRVDNLNDQELGSKVFKFGFDSGKNLPYIEFPSDIADLIEDGLEIYYIVSDGVEGNVSPNTITSFNTYSFDVTGVTEVEDSCYSLNNITSVSASEPETIDEAYKNFRKTIGTFNTLVSCKDYSNYIYTYQDDETNNHVVSNVQALDLRTDPNKSLSILHRDETGITYYENVLKDKVKYDSINDIILHGTKPYNFEISNASAYEVTYNLLTNSDAKEGIESILSDVKTISHILTTPSTDEIALIEERYTLHINISTKYKVNSTEQASILTNVRKALYNNFNARQLEFGEEIPYDEIISVIENADERIKLAVVDDPEINPYIIKATSSSKSQHAFDIDNNEQDRQIIVENILGGRIQLYIKDESLLFDYNMDFSNLDQYKHLAAIKTDLSLTIPQEQDNVSGYPLKKNESIQIIEDSYISTVTYPAYVYYGYKVTDGGQIKTEKGVPYKLQENETLYIYYTDSNDVKKIEQYGKGTIIRTNEFALPIGENTTPSRWYDTSSGEIKTESNPDYINLYALGTNETIEILKLNETILDNFNQRCFWYTRPIIGTNDIINQKENDLIFYKDESDDSGKTYYHILEENEMFVYPSEDNFALFSVGSGTKLQVIITDDIEKLKDPFINGKDKYGKGTIYIKAKETEKKIDLTQLQETINTQDISNFENSYDWTEVDFRAYPLHIVETSITTYIEGDEIQVEGNPLSLTSQWSNGTKLSLSTSVGKKFTGDITNAKIRSILSFTGNSVNPQIVVGKNQKITLYYYKDETIDNKGYYDEDKEAGVTPRYTAVSLSENQNIQINAIINDYNDIILRTMYYEEDEESLELIFNGRYEVPYSAIVYSLQDAKEEPLPLYGIITSKNKTKSASRNEYSFTWNEFYPLLTSNILTIDAPQNIDNIYINIFNQYNSETILKKAEGGKWTFNFTDKIPDEGQERESYNIFISTPILLNLNPLLEKQIKPDTLTKILGKIEQRTDFDYLADLSNSKLIDSYDLINSFFDYNNIYNPLTIAKIDFSSDVFKCNIVASSRK